MVLTALQVLADGQDRSAVVLRAALLRDGFRQGESAAAALSLSDLFQSESIPNDPEAYLDQRFVDYLAARSNELPQMHWRNFERLAAEYFTRLGYEVTLGPGSKDGGVDMRVWPSGSQRLGPPLLIVQCKRYAEERLVQLEHVKAFWADVQFANAERGFIATTARVSPEGKRIASARGYPLDFAEASDVSKWVRTMWRHPWKGEPQQIDLFYPLTPIYVADGANSDPGE